MLAILFLSFFLIHIFCQRRLWDVMPYVLSLIFLSLVHLFEFVSDPLEKGPEYLTSGKAQVCIPLIRFLPESFVSSSFLVLLRYSFWILPFICTCLMVSAFKMPKYLLVSFSASVLILSWFGSFITIICSCSNTSNSKSNSLSFIVHSLLNIFL